MQSPAPEHLYLSPCRHVQPPAPEHLYLSPHLCLPTQQQIAINEITPPSQKIQKQDESKVLENKMKYARKCLEVKRVTKQRNAALAKVSLLEYRVDVLKKEKKELQKKLDDIFINDEKMKKMLKDINNEEKYGPPNLTDTIIEELLINSKLSQYKHKFSNTLLSISFILMSYSPVAYRKLTEFIPFPCEKTIREKFKDQMRQTQENLLNINQLKVILNELHKFYTDDDDEVLTSVLAVDAAAMNPKQTNKKAFFGYQVQPTKKDCKPKFVHARLSPTGRFNKEVFQDIDAIFDAGKEERFDFKFVATDGDNKTNPLHTDLQDFVKQKSDTFDNAVDAMKDYPELPISDQLHLLKGMKKRYLKHKIKMTKESAEINHINEKEILELSSSYSPIVEESTSLTSMRDDLSLMLFNTENMYYLGISGHYPFFAYQFIPVLLIAVFQSRNLSLKARIQLCKVGYYCLKELNENSVEYNRKKINENEYLVRYVDINTSNRLSNNFLCYAYAYKYHVQNIQSSSLSSHPLELSFGRIRQCSLGNDTNDMALNVVAKSQVRDRLLDNLGKKESSVRGRCDLAGSCYTDEWNIEIPETINCDQIPIEIIQICNNEIEDEEFLTSNIWNLINFLNQTSPTYVPNLSGANSGSRIISRCINYK